MPTFSQCQQAAYAAANQYGLPPELVYSLLKQESSCRTDLTSPTGNKGIAQLGNGFIKDNCPGIDPFNPLQAIPCAAKGLSKLYNQFGSYALALAGYHAGAGNVAKSAPCVPPTKDKAFGNTTLSYVLSVLGMAGLPFDASKDCKGQTIPNGNGGVVGPPRGTTGGGTTTAPVTNVDIGSNFRMYLILGLALVLIVAVIGRYRG